MVMMRFLLLVIVGLLSFSLSAQGKDFYNNLDLNNAQREQLAQSYREAGNRFIEIGQKERGQYYLQLADEIEASSTAQATNDRASDSAQEPTTTEGETTTVPDAVSEEGSGEDITFNSQNEMVLEELPFDKDQKLNDNNKYEQDSLAPLPTPKKEGIEKGQAVDVNGASDKKAIVDAVISNYFTGLLSEDWETINLSTSQILALTGYEKPLDKANQKKFFEEMFAVYQFNNLTIDQIYDMASKDITVLDGDSNRCIVTIKAKETAPAELADWQYWRGFWAKTHYYFIEKLGDKWVVIAFDIDTATAQPATDANATTAPSAESKPNA